MKRLLFHFFILAASMLMFSPVCNAMTTIGEMTRNAKGYDHLTGLFGGVRNGNVMELKMSNKGHVRFLKMPEQLYVNSNGAQVLIKDITLLTPLKVTMDNGKVSSIEIIGGTQ